MSTTDWISDVELKTATHKALGVVVEFTQDAHDSWAWDGKIIKGEIPREHMNHAARMMREAGNVFVLALHQKQGDQTRKITPAPCKKCGAVGLLISRPNYAQPSHYVTCTSTSCGHTSPAATVATAALKMWNDGL